MVDKSLDNNIIPNGTERNGTERNGTERNGTERIAVIPCKLDKMPEGKLTSMNNATICDFYTKTASTVTSRYYKGIGGHKDNMVMEIWKK